MMSTPQLEQYSYTLIKCSVLIVFKEINHLLHMVIFQQDLDLKFLEVLIIGSNRQIYQLQTNFIWYMQYLVIYNIFITLIKLPISNRSKEIKLAIFTANNMLYCQPVYG